MAAIGYVLLVALGVDAAGSNARHRRSWPGAAALWSLVAVPSLVQLAVPGLLDVARRDPDLITAGQVWRVATSALVQDGGVAGTAFNLIVLAVTAATSATVLGGRGLWVTFWTGAVGGNLLVLALLPSVGAGNSLATFSVSAATVAAVARATPTRAAQLRQVAVVLIGTLLLVVGDLHGFAAVVGTIVGWLWPPARAARRE